MARGKRKSRYKPNIRGYRYHSDAVIKQCMSVIAQTIVDEIEGVFPEADYGNFFTADERLELSE